MLYTVECTYSDPGSEQAWNDFYSQEKLPALVSVSGFISSQCFQAINAGCPVYLAIHTIRNAEVITSEEYRLKGGGNFSGWQSCITDWRHNLYECADSAPAVSADERLLLSSQPLGFIETELGYRAWSWQASGVDRCPQWRIAYVLATEHAELLTEVPGTCLYKPLTLQLYNPAHRQLRGWQ